MQNTNNVLCLLPLLLPCALATSLGCRSPALPHAGGVEAASAVVRQMVHDGEAPGVRYLFLDEHEVLFSTEAGSADLPRGVPVDEHTTFNGYSISKTFTAAAVLKLADEGLLDLDDPIASYIPELPGDHAPTLRQTLEHTAGFANPVPVGWVHLASEDEGFDEEAFFARVLAEHGRLEAEPGARFAYSNVGYLMLGEVVRRVSGLPYDEYVEREIIGPLALEEGDALGFAIPDADAHARGYLQQWSFLDLALGLFLDRGRYLSGTHEGWHQFRDLLVDGDAYGGVVGNAGGFARYLQAILRADGPFTPDMVEVMLTPGTTSSGETTPTALAWFRGDLDGEPYFAHAGGAGGYYCEIRVYPRVGRASVLLSNRSAMSDARSLDRVDRFLLPGAEHGLASMQEVLP